MSFVLPVDPDDKNETALAYLERIKRSIAEAENPWMRNARVPGPFWAAEILMEPVDYFEAMRWEEAEAREEDTSQCAACGNTDGGLKRCARCKEVRYCSPLCQKTHWPAHKLSCGAVAD
jgi:hypothetical protein